MPKTEIPGLSRKYLGLLIKFASLAVHVEEWGETANPFDLESAKALLDDPDVRAFIDDPRNAVYLPVKRSKRKA